jgi:tRNA (guanosine-2'-O-)-methyltransferase
MSDKVPREVVEIRAVNRRELSATSLGKTSKWPRTSRRQQRIADVIGRRQPDLTLVLENVHDPHNVSSVLRTCDAVGILGVHLIYTSEEPPAKAFARTTSASAAKWVETTRHESVAVCYASLRRMGFTILATALADGASDLYDVDLRRPVAIAFGNEVRGLTEEAIAQADGRIFLPMLGMVESLNISVACAVTLYEALRQRREAGDYASAKIPEADRAKLVEAWLKR